MEAPGNAGNLLPNVSPGDPKRQLPVLELSLIQPNPHVIIARLQTTQVGSETMRPPLVLLLPLVRALEILGTPEPGDCIPSGRATEQIINERFRVGKCFPHSIPLIIR